MGALTKIRVQGLLDPEMAKTVQERAFKGRRPVSREVEYLIALGLAAETSNASEKAT